MDTLPWLSTEAMCAVDGTGCRLACFGTRRDSALEKPLPTSNSWWFPPPDLRRVTVFHLLRESREHPKRRFAIMVPNILGAPWWKRCHSEMTLALTFEKGMRLFAETQLGKECMCAKTNLQWSIFVNKTFTYTDFSARWGFSFLSSKGDSYVTPGRTLVSTAMTPVCWIGPNNVTIVGPDQPQLHRLKLYLISNLPPFTFTDKGLEPGILSPGF
jgi:hypothetical protein